MATAINRRCDGLDHTPTKDAVCRCHPDGRRVGNLSRRVAHVVNDLTMQPDVTVYLRADVATCLRRIAGRARPAESAIDQAYLQAIADGYGRWLDDIGRRRHERVVVVDADAHNLAQESDALGRLATVLSEAQPGITYCNPFLDDAAEPG